MVNELIDEKEPDMKVFKKLFWERNMHPASSNSYSADSLVFTSGAARIAEGWFREGWKASQQQRTEGTDNEN